MRENKKAFYQIEVEISDRHKNEFSTWNRHFAFLEMPFGLKNVLGHTLYIIRKYYLNYLDDIVMLSTYP